MSGATLHPLMALGTFSQYIVLPETQVSAGMCSVQSSIEYHWPGSSSTGLHAPVPCDPRGVRGADWVGGGQGRG